MPLLIGRLACVILLVVAAGPVRAQTEAPTPEHASENGFVAPDGSAGEPGEPPTTEIPEEPTDATPAAQDTTSPGGIPEWLDLSLLGAHVVWGIAAAIWLWRRRRRLLTPDPALRPNVGPEAGPLGWTLLFGALLMWLSLLLGAGSAQALLGLEEAALGTLRGQALLQLGGYAGAILAFGFVVSLAPTLIRAMGRLPRLGDVPRALGAYAAVHPFVWLTGVVGVWVARAVAGPERPIDPLAHQTLRALAESPTDAWWLMTVGAAVIGAPLVEELVYRVLIQNGLSRLTRAPLLSVVVTSLIFALIHTGEVRAHALPTLFVLSLGLGLAYMRTGRMAVPVIMHMTFNALNLVLAFAVRG